MNEYLQSTPLFLLLLIAVSVLLLNHYKGFKYDPKEPPLIPQRIPYVGHVFELIRNGNKYYSSIRLVSVPPTVSAQDLQLRELLVPVIRFQSTRSECSVDVHM